MMSTTQPIGVAAKKALSRFERAVADRAFKGSATPEVRAWIEREYEMSKANLMKYLRPQQVLRLGSADDLRSKPLPWAGRLPTEEDAPL